jgi:RNA polymerase sigma factor (sigma-70 family)
MVGPPSIDEVLAEHGAMITRIVAAYEAVPDRASDLAQEILIALWKALPQFRGEASVRTFVARIAQNRCVSHVVRHHKAARLTELSDDLPSPGDGPEELAIDADRRQQLLAAIRSLPLAYRGPVTLAVEGFSSLDIAQLMGISVNAVAVRLTRAKTFLRAKLKDEP